MAAVTICSDLGAPKNKSLTLFPLFPHLFPMKWWDQMPWSSFSECWTLRQLFRSPLSLTSSGFLIPLHLLPLGWYHLHIWGYWYFSHNLDSSLCSFQPSVSHDVLCIWASLVAQLVKNLPAMQETCVQSLGWENTLETGKATHSSTLAWRIPYTV